MEVTRVDLCDLLIQCLRKHGDGPDKHLMESLSAEDWRGLLSLAAVQRVTSLLWQRLKQKQLDGLIPEAAALQLREAFQLNTMRNLRFNGELSRLLAALEQENIPLIVLKGMVLSNTVYENIGLREMNDIDVLARPHDVERIAGILTGMGYRPMASFDIDNLQKVAKHLPRFIKEKHAGIEIHWNITKPGKRYYIDPQGLWHRAVPVTISNRQTYMPALEDMLLHLCLHASYQHLLFFGLRPFCDVAECIEQYAGELNWQVFTQRAVSQGWCRGVFLILYFARELLDAAVPGEVLERLKPGDMSDGLLETARAQIFSEKMLYVSVTDPFCELLEKKRLADKIKMFSRRVFLPRSIISAQYNISENSPLIFCYYPRRFYDLLLRHGGTWKKYRQGDTGLQSFVARKTAVADWMAGD